MKENMFTETECHREVVKTVVRVLYDAIATHEAVHKNYIEVGWLRDYADNIAETLPKLTPDEDHSEKK